MYFFYLDESGSRDPSVGTSEKPKDHIYVLLAVGMYEGQWRPFEMEVSGLKLRLAHRLRSEGKGQFEIADCEVKSNWLRLAEAREKDSRFLSALEAEDIKRITDIYSEQVSKRSCVVIATVVDKRYLHPGTTGDAFHQIAYELLLERVQNYMVEHQPWHQALVVMDDTSIQLNRAVAMKHESLLRRGNPNMRFANIVEYPFFTRSELSNGVQLADQLAYNVYRAFRNEDVEYPYFEELFPHFYRGLNDIALHGLKVWPNNSPLVRVGRAGWEAYQQKALR